MHAFGCRVLQKAVENLPDGHKAELLEELHGCAKRLIEDAFGSEYQAFLFRLTRLWLTR